jgi:hypothetical protein
VFRWLLITLPTNNKSFAKEIMKRIFAILAVLFSSLPAMATIGSSVITANESFTTNVGDVVTVTATVVGCGTGQLPLYQGNVISLTPNQTPSAPFTATNTGSAQSIMFTVPGNDAITCGGQNYTLYALTWYDNGFPLAPTATYRFTDNSNLTLSNLVPVSFVPPVLNNAAGAICPAATPVFSGFSSTYQIQCGVAGTAAGMPLSGGTFSGPVTFGTGSSATFQSGATLTITYQGHFYSTWINGIPQADQYPATDVCAAIYAASIAAVQKGVAVIDATHLSGVNTCTSGTNPFGIFNAGVGISEYAAANLTYLFGNMELISNTPFEIANSAITIQGYGPDQTVFVYNGGSGAVAAMYIHAQSSGVTNGLEEDHFRNFMVVNAATSSPQAAILARDVNRSSFEDVAAWGAGSSYAGMDFQGNVTTSYTRPKVSQREYANLPSAWTSGLTVSTPGIGMDWDASSASGDQCTDSTVTDAAAEYITAGNGYGWYLNSANSMTFTSGTSEANKYGVVVSPGSKFNTFTSLDLEANTANATGVDIHDYGQANTYIGALATSTCSGGCASVAYANGGAVNYLIASQGVNSQSGQFVNMSGSQDFSQGNGTTTVSTLIAVGGASFGNAIQVPMVLTTAAAVTFFAGTGITSVTCADPASSGNTCTNMRGTIKVVNSSATTTTSFAEVIFGSTLSAKPVCQITQQEGPAWYGLYVSAVGVSDFYIANANTLSGSGTFYITYYCQL